MVKASLRSKFVFEMCLRTGYIQQNVEGTVHLLYVGLYKEHRGKQDERKDTF